MVRDNNCRVCGASIDQSVADSSLTVLESIALVQRKPDPRAWAKRLALICADCLRLARHVETTPDSPDTQ